MIHSSDQADNNKVQSIINDYDAGDSEMTVPDQVLNLDKPVLIYIISRLLAESN